ncbi:MAG: bifunctional phosphopantothenoylcysteine decarboxylase/phosphopantothenate--cysteine ligase CoaBC [Natronospirillum sp.]|uniref:bifunctional phosphopantothenoylcysteine decarboxylase/phosphopantothenate--cysteine ligase CoaBC n=1 Tax=Natronospirillum sp. TaxID=2812955 RepID=UPI0025D9B460|nr:bifunctional phosphopantothenoylcysteine decarboxylase/phosphopantothenate--cysteine ligase CoaBC [Natronospirillum sp.]MCH8551687.1 bifunctional phosphopantothenoylcysteine decarboxylase/phosphopantothenate--cysteine ligase CoaBC [Natronospirillum sp.]
MSLQGQRILLGISGGIAAYKSAELARLLSKAGAEVQVVMTPGAQAFITPLTFQALTGRPARTELLDEDAEQGMGHIELARWATLVLLAPATASLLARMRAGMADDLLTTVLLASQAPVAIAPAMNQAMWAHAATQANVQGLTELYDPQWIGPDSGDQACGDFGAGRMSEPAAIVQALQERFAEKKSAWAGRRVVVTAGPTREAIDPVRYLSNHSSGRMGFALAEAAARQGAQVVLISGPVQLATPPGVERIDVESAQDMWQAAQTAAPKADLFIGAAAVADYRVENPSDQKQKKQQGKNEWQLTLVQNPDIIDGVSRLKDRPKQVVGFAAETQDVERYAWDKLARKNLDWIVANDVSRTDIGFNSDDNEVTVFGRQNERYDIGRQPKSVLADALLDVFARGFPED